MIVYVVDPSARRDGLKQQGQYYHRQQQKQQLRSCHRHFVNALCPRSFTPRPNKRTCFSLRWMERIRLPSGHQAGQSVLHRQLSLSCEHEGLHSFHILIAWAATTYLSGQVDRHLSLPTSPGPVNTTAFTNNHSLVHKRQKQAIVVGRDDRL